MKKSNILVTTLGSVWQLIPELIGFTDPQSVPIYNNHSQVLYLQQLRDQYQLNPVEVLWIIMTDENTEKTIQPIRSWQSGLPWSGKIKFFILKGVADLTSAQQIRQMSDLIYRVVFHAKRVSQKGQLLLSLVGGRKTMSADMQQAGHLFGCDALLHVTDDRRLSRDDFFQSFRFNTPIPPSLADAYLPVVISGRINKNVALDFPPPIRINDFPLNSKDQINYIEPQTALVTEIEKRLTNARNLMFNYSLSLSGNHKQTNYRALYALAPDQIEVLQTVKIGVHHEQAEHEKSLLRKLPKAELHCHFGGILTAAEMIETAKANGEAISRQRKINPEFDVWLNKMALIIESENLSHLRREVPDVKALRVKFPHIRQPITIAGFLSLFDEKISFLDRFIFGKYLNTLAFSAIGIETYESLGDLQGSALMQSEASLRAACRILIKKCERHNVRYLELRQSPINYTKGGLAPKQVVDIIRDELTQSQTTTFKALFIASRHGKMSEVHRHIELAQELFEEDAAYRDWIVGFDLAGAESARTPSELRQAFMPLMKESMNITIHAGENQPVENIWEAVYHLNADRIGHGLTLNQNSRLKTRFLDRKITLEMCPSSNDQIVGYTNGVTAYPLKGYLAQGLRVSVNTDNPGISRTTFSDEYYKAALLSPNGLSLWEILQLIRNAFRAAFIPFEERQKLLLASEKEIIEIVKESIN